MGIDNETVNATALLSNNAYCKNNCKNQFLYKSNIYHIERYTHRPFWPFNKLKHDENGNSIANSYIKMQNKMPYDKLMANIFLLMKKTENIESKTGYKVIPKFLYDTQIGYAYNAKANIAFIVVRGSNSKSNWLTDLDVTPVEFLNTKTHVLAGWYNYMSVALNSYSDNTYLTLDQEIAIATKNQAKFIVTGHSLGGSVAPLFAAYLHTKYKVSGDDIQLITYAEGPIYMADFVQKYESTFSHYIHFYNIGNPNCQTSIIGDPVVSLPLIFKTHPFGYSQLVSDDSDKNGGLAPLVPKSAPEKIKYLLSLHSMNDYQAYIQETYIKGQKFVFWI
ncbi:lipase family protein [Facilibium subflavum]|uniref:lipase family protein n=1 Tax=Facilibium subflavum TaxID=2219058 RepID=UPI0013C33A18|nr:lipase family protein [Facilibium subflavum]